jgi:hypothetical protein
MLYSRFLIMIWYLLADFGGNSADRRLHERAGAGGAGHAADEFSDAAWLSPVAAVACRRLALRHHRTLPVGRRRVAQNPEAVKMDAKFQ